MRTLLILAIVASTAIGGTRWHLVPPSTAAGVVNGRVELINSKLKPRGGRVDSSGVVIWLTPLDRAARRGAAKQKRTINQRDKRFSPHVVAIEAGSQVDFPNDDPFFHNVFSIYNGRKFDLGLYASGETRPVTFSRPGVSYIFCNIHPQMSAVVVALNSPWFAVSDSSGAFSIANVPEGRYRLGVWHERAKPELLDALARDVRVTANGSNIGVIQINEEGYLPRPHLNKHGQEYDSRESKPGYRKP